MLFQENNKTKYIKSLKFLESIFDQRNSGLNSINYKIDRKIYAKTK